MVSNTNLTITFSEPVNVAGNWLQIVCATSGTRNVADTAVSGGPTTFTINPNVDFTPGELCTVTVFAAQVSDQDPSDPPDNMAANHVFSFTIDQAPSVTMTTPADNATGVAANTNITITFSEPVNVTGNWFTDRLRHRHAERRRHARDRGSDHASLINPNADLRRWGDLHGDGVCRAGDGSGHRRTRRTTWPRTSSSTSASPGRRG